MEVNFLLQFVEIHYWKAAYEMLYYFAENNLLKKIEIMTNKD